MWMFCESVPFQQSSLQVYIRLLILPKPAIKRAASRDSEELAKDTKQELMLV